MSVWPSMTCGGMPWRALNFRTWRPWSFGAGGHGCRAFEGLRRQARESPELQDLEALELRGRGAGLRGPAAAGKGEPGTSGPGGPGASGPGAGPSRTCGGRPGRALNFRTWRAWSFGAGCSGNLATGP
ncbi:MAG: hypothetical protein LBT40_11195 [Deltaproteobacteria bacterium]|nr:hypothetical protein [Deltaproteobacteria bacterium]